MGGPKSRPAGALALAILSLALPAPVGAQESPSPEVGPGPAVSLSPAASALAVEAQAILAEVFAQTAQSSEVAAAAARTAEIERSGLDAVDPGAAARLAELEAQAAAGFATFLAAAPPLPGPSPSAEPADASPEPSPSAQADTFAFLAAAAPGPRDDHLRFAQGGSTISSIGGVLGWASNEIRDFKPSKDSGRSRSEPYVSGDSRYRIDSAWERDTLTLIIEASERYSVPGATPGSPPFEVTDTGGTTLQVDTCPDDGRHHHRQRQRLGHLRRRGRRALVSRQPRHARCGHGDRRRRCRDRRPRSTTSPSVALPWETAPRSSALRALSIRSSMPA